MVAKLPNVPATPTGVFALMLALISLTDLPDWAKTTALWAALALAVFWVWLVARPYLRLQWPIARKKKVPAPSAADQERMDTVRHLKETFLAFFHSWGSPAMEQALLVARELAAKMGGRQEPWPTCAALFRSVIRDAESAEGKLRKELEGTFWDSDVSESVRKRTFEMDVEKQDPLLLGVDLFLYLGDYDILIKWNDRIAQRLGGDVNGYSPGFMPITGSPSRFRHLRALGGCPSPFDMK
jgi:hypothetical protein